MFWVVVLKILFLLHPLIILDWCFLWQLFFYCVSGMSRYCLDNCSVSSSNFCMSSLNWRFNPTIAKDSDNKIIPTNKTNRDYSNASIVNSFFLTPVNHKELESLIKEMNTSKSVGPSLYPQIYLNSHAQSFQNL